MTRHAPRVVVAARDARDGPSFDRLHDLVLALAGRGLRPEIVLVGDGERLADLRRLGRVTVVDHFRRRGIAWLPHLLRVPGATRRLKVWRLRRWLDRASRLPWVVHDPAAAGLLRHSARRPPVLIGCLPVADLRPSDLADLDRAALDDADRWLTCTDLQAAQALEAGLRKPSALGRFVPPSADDDPDDAQDPERWPVLLVPTPDAWHSVNHTLEVVRHLAVRHASLDVAWLVHGEQDRWLAQFDLDHAGLAHAASCCSAEEVAGRPARALVRTGYGPGEADWLDVMAEAGVAVVAFADADDAAPEPFDRPAPFAVEELLAILDRALDDDTAVRRAREQLARRRLQRERLTAALDDLVAALRAPGDQAS